MWPDCEWEGLVDQHEGGRCHEVDLDVPAARQQTLQLGGLQSTLRSEDYINWIHESREPLFLERCC